MTELEQLTEKTLGGLRVQPVAERIAYLNFLVYGEPGVGKTVLAGSSAEVSEMAPVLILDVEGGTFSIRDRNPEVDVVRVQTWNDMQKVYDGLVKGELVYKTVVLDSLTEIQKFSMGLIMEKLVKDDPERDPDVPGMREWGKNIEQIRRLVRAFRDLPMNTIFTALSVSTRDPRTGLDKIRPGLSGKLSGEVAGFVDIVGYMYVKSIDGELQRLLLTAATDTQVAKDRSAKLPPVVQNPTLPTIYQSIFGGNET